jgi:cytochrome c biogenesis protein CcmG/thiol:disulfide interchange protein DsbE
VQTGSIRVIRLNVAADVRGSWFSVRSSAHRALLIALCFGLIGFRPAVAADEVLHKRAPEFIRTDLKNQKLDLNGYRGKVVLLNFWATWCGPCRVEMPRFVEWQKKYGPRGLRVVGISMDDSSEPVRAMYQKLNLNYRVAMGDETLGEMYGGILGLPVTFLIDRHGEVIAKFQGQTDMNKMELKMQSLLRGQ